MPNLLDTPARAAQAQRPQTREWRRLLSEAEARDESATAIRRKLRLHLEAADRLAAKHHTLNVATEPDPHPLQELESFEAHWDRRVFVLKELQANPSEYDLTPAAPWLAKQLTELRSAVVVWASNAIVAVAAAQLFTAAQASQIFSAAAGGVNISKKVMAEARRVAALAALNGQTERSVFDAVVNVAKESPQTAARRLALDALLAALGNSSKPSDLSEQISDALAVGAIDRAAEVREGARELAKVFKERFGDDEWNNLKKTLPSDAAARLSINLASKNATTDRTVGPAAKATSLARKKGRTIKELMKLKREAMKNQKATKGGGGKGSAKKRTDGESELDGRGDPPKKGAFMTHDKENVLNGS